MEARLWAGGGIDGVILMKRTIIEDDRGSIIKLWRADDEVGWRVDEVYCSTCKPRVVKAWHLHKKMTLRYVCLRSQVLVGMVDLRPDSPTRGNVERIYLSNGILGAMFMLVIPPGVWNGYRVVQGREEEAMIINLPDMAHDPQEIVRRHPATAPAPELRDFDWGPYELAG